MNPAMRPIHLQAVLELTEELICCGQFWLHHFPAGVHISGQMLANRYAPALGFDFARANVRDRWIG